MSPSSRYLNDPVGQFGLAGVFLCWCAYGILTGLTSYPGASYALMLMVGAAGMALASKPRWIVYALLMGAFIVRLYSFVHVVANGSQDPQSIRDEAVEATAAALLSGINAWNVDPALNVTTGPTSILLALPFVFLSGQVNWLTFVFWVVFLGILLGCDIGLQNRTFPVLVVVFMLGLFDIEHTWYWSLDELSYGILFIVAGYWLSRAGRWSGTGAMFAAAALARPSYLFMLAGFGFWYRLDTSFSWRRTLQLAVGFVLGCVAILLPFVVVGGHDLWMNNPWRRAADFRRATWPDTNVAFQLLNRMSTQIGSEAMLIVKLTLVLVLMLGLALSLRRRNIAHPFWHMTAGALLAHTIVWLPSTLPRDYTLMFALPGMLAIAFTPTSDPPVEPRADVPESAWCPRPPAG